MKTAIIFGHTGQDGYYLAQILSDKGIKVYGVSRTTSDLPCSLEDYDSLCNTMKVLQPDYIYNLAAVSTTRHDVLLVNHSTISTGTCYLLEAIRKYSPQTKIFISGSGLQFVNCNKPLDEVTPLDATSSYSVERNYTLYLARYFRNKFQLKVYYGFFFTHDSPRRTAQHMSQKIVMAAKVAAQGSKEKLLVGNIKVRKEYLFAGDAMRAAYTLVNQGHIYEAVIGTGIDYSIEDWLKTCYSLVGLNWKEYVSVKNDFVPEYNRLVSKPDRIFSLGWKPKVGFSELAQMMMETI